MPHIIERVIACGRCAERTQFFASLGFQVQGCSPHPSQPGDCVLRMTDPALEGLAPVAAPAAATVMPAAPAAPPIAHAAAAAVATAGSTGSTGSNAGSTGSAACSPLQARAAQAIVNLFETSEVLGDYGKVSVLAGDTGHLSFGRAQTTLGSGSLALLIERYAGMSGARFGSRLLVSLERMRQRDLSLDHDRVLHNVLRASADDPLMRQTQDAFFDAAYWAPALRAAARTGLSTPLALALVYDGHVQGSWGTVRDLTVQAAGTVAQRGEHDWVARYIAQRRQWLAAHARADLRKTVYRMDAFQGLLDLGLWDLPLPFVVCGKEVSAATLDGQPPRCWDGPAPGTRALALQTPLLAGLDVRLLQLGLCERGVDLQADGVYGPGTRHGVRQFQAARGLAPSGALDAAQVASLAA